MIPIPSTFPSPPNDITPKLYKVFAKPFLAPKQALIEIQSSYLILSWQAPRPSFNVMHIRDGLYKQGFLFPTGAVLVYAQKVKKTQKSKRKQKQ